MSTDQQPEDAWRPCQPGELGQAVGVLRSRKRNGTLLKSAGLATAALVLLLVGGYTASTFLTPPSAPNQGFYAGIGCAEVHGLLPELQREQLPEAKSAQVKAHLDQCPKCRKAYERLQNAATHRQQTSPTTIALLGQ